MWYFGIDLSSFFKEFILIKESTEIHKREKTNITTFKRTEKRGGRAHSISSNVKIAEARNWS